jgi:hypothetical protein
VPTPSNTVLLEAQKQWFFTDEELLRTPSLLDGMDLETEHMHRSKGVNFIMQVGMMLKLPQLTLTTAAVFMHRFFVRHHICDPPRSQGHHAYSVAAGCVLLASKVDENCRKIKEVVIACCRVAQKKPNLELDEQDKEFWKWKDTLLAYEDLALEALCFDLQLEQPHKICYDFLCYFGKNDHRLLRNAAWAFLNDCNFTVLCLLFYPRTIAAAALWAGARLCDVAFEDDEEGRPWWVQLDVNLADVQRAVSRMTELYEKNTVHRKSHQYPTNSADSDGAAETTRIVNPHPIRSTDEPATTSADADGASNGRKRSRDAEDESMSRPERSSSQLRVNNNNNNNSHEPSPKRQRTASPPNGYRASSRIPAAARHHPLPRPLPVSASVNGSNASQAGDSVDSVQQRIDEIVHQGSRNGNTNNSNNYSGRDRDRDQNWDRDRDHDRERDRDRDRDWDSRGRGRGEDSYGGGSDRDARRPSVATNTSTGSDTRHHHHHQQHRPTRNGNEIPMRGQRRGAYDEEEEEGEINSDREEGEVTSTNPASTQHHADDDDDGGGSEEGEL